TNASSSTLSIIDTATNTVVSTKLVGSNPIGVAVNPAGGLVYVASSGSGRVSKIIVATGASVTLQAPFVGAQGVAVSRDGSRVFVTKANGTVSVIDATTDIVIDEVVVGSVPRGVSVDNSGRAWVINEDATVSV